MVFVVSELTREEAPNGPVSTLIVTPHCTTILEAGSTTKRSLVAEEPPPICTGFAYAFPSFLSCHKQACRQGRGQVHGLNLMPFLTEQILVECCPT
jgi:hypothetical protein